MPKFIVLDLDKTLIHQTSITASEVEQYHERNDGFIISDSYILGLSFVQKRKHLDHFIAQLIQRGKTIIVWSAASERYVKTITEVLFGRDVPRYVLTYEHYLASGNKKDISLISKLKLVEEFVLDEAILIEDTPENGEDNPKHMIVVKPFTGNEDDELLRVLEHIG
jgi:TFIIF-interacting CTD phosphatase-like protein